VLLPIGEEAIDRFRCESLLDDLNSIPDQLGIPNDRATLLLDHADAALLPIVGKLRATRPDGDGDELIPRIPLEGAGAVGGEIATGVNGSTCVGFPSIDGRSLLVEVVVRACEAGPVDAAVERSNDAGHNWTQLSCRDARVQPRVCSLLTAAPMPAAFASSHVSRRRCARCAAVQRNTGGP
jgi:hypothetical protein